MSKRKKGKVIQDLYLRQKKIFRNACYGTAILLTAFATLLYFHLQIDWFLPSIVLAYAILVLLNIIAFEAHRHIVQAWFVMMAVMYTFVIHTIYLTGGIKSGMSTVLVGFSFVSYVYGRKQGRIGFVISILIFVGFIVMDRYSSLQFPNMIPESSITTFNLYALLLSCITLGLFFGEMMARTTYNAYKSKQEIENQHIIITEKNREIEILSVVANQSDLSMLVIDLVGRIIWMNDSVQKKYDTEKQRILNHAGESRSDNPLPYGMIGELEELALNRDYVTDRITIYDLAINVDLRRHISRVKEKKKPLAYETSEKTEKGDERWVLSTITPIFDQDGQIFQMSIVDTQITEQKHIEAEIRTKSTELVKQRDEIEEQRHIATSHRDEILASITYAKKIQSAMLRYESRITEKVPNHFILFQPKDIVSGDFYWMMQKNNHIYLAVADCTGHGVPGAMLAMLGAGYLNEICSINRELLPSFILDELRDKFMNDLEQDGKKNSRMDGMDISLIRLDLDSGALEWSGANNPILLIRNGEMEFVKGNVQPIGFSEDATLFTNHSFQVNKGDGIYLYSDGYSDQFGGPYRRKYGNRRFREQILATHSLDLAAQKIRLSNNLENWRTETNEERTDDVCVLGIRI